MNRKYKNLVLNLIQKELWSWTPKIKVWLTLPLVIWLTVALRDVVKKRTRTGGRERDVIRVVLNV
jgi:hypothetical protein